MPEETLLSDEFLRELTAAGEVDVLVGIPTLNNRKTIERVLNAAQLGLVKHFPRERTVLIIPDGGSRDGTLDAVREAMIQDFRPILSTSPLRTVHRITTSYPGIQGRGFGVKVVLAAADLLRAKACALISPDLESMTPEWIESLIRPVLREQFDYVTPLYRRHKFDGVLVKNLLSPALSAIYHQKIYEPMGGELAFSGRFACHCLEQADWHEQAVRFGVELWMTVRAMVNGFRIGQAFLGPKVHAAPPVGQGLVETIQRSVGALFNSMEKNEEAWLTNSPMQAVPSFGPAPSVALDPQRINKKRIVEMFRSGTEELGSVLQSILTPETLAEIQAVAKAADGSFVFSDELWVKAVYEFACSYHHSVINRDHLLQAMTPLYRGRLASYVLNKQGTDGETITRELDDLCALFERMKPNLIEGWTRKK